MTSVGGFLRRLSGGAVAGVTHCVTQMGGQSTLAESRVLEGEPSAQPPAWLGPASIGMAPLKVSVCDEKPIQFFKKVYRSFFPTQNENSFIEFHGNDI